MKEISLESLPPCFEKWCAKFDDLWDNKGKKKGFRCYLAGLLGESKRKNLTQITDNIVGSSYHNVHHFLGKSTVTVPEYYTTIGVSVSIGVSGNRDGADKPNRLALIASVR